MRRLLQARENSVSLPRPRRVRMARRNREYTPQHAAAGTQVELPAIETWPNQYRGYEIKISIPEYTSICPRTGLPDFGTITIRYLPEKHCLELKSLKYYILAYRNLGVFYENAVNRILDDLVRACRPKWAIVTGEFRTRGGMSTTIEARYPRPRK
jgi:7-cyano-7-deazaguanine reductase